jgi:hypothetical protein
VAAVILAWLPLITMDTSLLGLVLGAAAALLYLCWRWR